MTAAGVDGGRVKASMSRWLGGRSPVCGYRALLMTSYSRSMMAVTCRPTCYSHSQAQLVKI